MADRPSLVRRGSWCLIACLLATHLAGSAAPAQAAPVAGHTYLVNSPLDEPDADPASGSCSSTPSAKCTLRAAIMLSDYQAGPNTILLPAGDFVLTRPGYDTSALVGDLNIAHDLTLQGAGPGATIVDGNGAVTGDRVFQIQATVQTVALTGLTIRNGRSLSSTVGVIGGGGLEMDGAGQLTLTDVDFENNIGQNGGALYANFNAQGGSLTLDQVILRGNTAIAGGVGAGGGLFASLLASSSQVALRDSQVVSNTADGTGGGVFITGSTAAAWLVEGSQFYSNTAASGGAIGNFVPLDLSDSQLHDNRASFDGGAIEAFAPLVIARTTLAANTAGRFGGGLFDLQTDSNALYPVFADISQSTLSANGAQFGGAIYHDGYITPNSLLSLTNSTVNGNAAVRKGSGGGVYVYGGQAQLFNATLANNRVVLGLPVAGPGMGGGLYLTATAVLTAENSIIANNTRGDGIRTPTLDDCFSFGTTGELAYDLIRVTANCSVTGPQGGLIIGQDPLLGPLQDNGGSTQTQALLPGSPAIDAGAPTGCTGADGAPITNDQRGAVRPEDPTCDLGAYEVVPEADLAVGQQASRAQSRPGAPITYTLTVTNTGPAPATGVVLTDTLPAGVTLRAVTPSQGSCLGTAPIVCNLGPLGSGAPATVTVGVTPAIAARLTNTATVAANEFDPALANNTASETTTVGWVLLLPLVTRGP